MLNEEFKSFKVQLFYTHSIQNAGNLNIAADMLYVQIL